MTRQRGTGAVRAPYTRVLSLCLAISALTLPAVGLGQVAPPPGIKLGEGRLHPFLGVDGRFDSLVGYFGLADGAPQPSSDLILTFRPGLRFDLSNDSNQVAFDGMAEYLWYTGLMAPSATQLSRLQANVGIDARFNRDGAVEVQLSDRVARSEATLNPVAGVGLISLYNTARLAVPIHSGGRAIEVTPSVAFTVEFFDPLLTGFIQGCVETDSTCNPALVSQMNYGNLTAGLAVRWKFLPKTAIALDTSFDQRIYFAGENLPGRVLRAQLGLVGLLSPRISVTLLGGYGVNFDADLHTPIIQAELAYLPSDTAKLAVGYVRTIQPVSVLGSFIDDRGFVTGSLRVAGGRVVLAAQAAIDYFWYFAPSLRNDLTLSGSAGPSFVVASWLDVSASYRLTVRNSTSAVSNINFLRHEAMLSLNFHY